MWFLFALITMLCWGAADLFYKKSADESDRYSHLKTSVMVGIVMGIHAILTLIFGDINYDFKNLLYYLPVSIMYILSMTVGYFGLRYLELSISSPIQNASGAVSCILLLIVLGEKLDLLSSIAVILICAGVFALGFFEKKELDAGDKKYTIGFIAFFMPILYCIIDALGTFLDGYYLDDFATTPLVGVTEETFETVANVSYELTFLIVAVILLFYICVIKKQKFEFAKQKDKGVAAIFETAGQFTYVFAMSGMAVVSAPMISAYCIVSLILSRIFIKEKLSIPQYITVAAVILGIIILGIAEG